MAISLALFPCEWFLRYRQHSIRDSDRMDPGLMVYDKDLGWRLALNWKGRHRHHDFDAKYTTNSYGYRGEFRTRPLTPGLGRRYAVVGDSFTFGFGVGDHETFTALLTDRYSSKNVYLNFGVPGYSTDQEYLLIRKQVLYFSPDHILLMVYLANDLFDNALPYPLQANRPKPFFSLSAGQLSLENTPVPLMAKSGEAMKLDLNRIVFGKGKKPDGFIIRTMDRFELLKLVKPFVHRPIDLSEGFNDRFSPYLQLFMAIIDKLQKACEEKNIGLSVVMMPGRSFVERPNSPSAQFQNFLRQRIVQDTGMEKIEVLDLAHHLRERYRSSPGDWYFPNEGHLAPEGHRVVAEILAEQLP